MPPTATRSLWTGRTLALVGIVLVALNLRTAVSSLSPIYHQISRDVPLDATVIGIIGAAPPLMFAAAGVVAPAISRRLGLERSLLAGVVAIVVGSLLRSLAPSALLLVIGMIITLMGAGVANILLPPAVKRYFPDRIALLTTVYATMLAFSAAVPAILAVPVADALGWRYSLGIWVAFAVVAIAPWLSLTIQHAREQARLRATDAEVVEVEAGLEARVWRSPVAWTIALTFAVSALNVYGAFAWLPSLLVDTAGVTPTAAGALLSLCAIMGLPSGILLPLVAQRMRNVAPLVFVGVGFFVAGYLGLLFIPSTATVVWVVCIGLGPLLFPLALLLIVSRTRTHAGSVALSGFAQAIGYVLGALGPLVVGILHDVTGGWTLPILFLLAVSLCGIFTGLALAKPRYLEDTLRLPRGGPISSGPISGGPISGGSRP